MKPSPESIPPAEAWLYANEAALSNVEHGLEQARKGELGDGPDLFVQTADAQHNAHPHDRIDSSDAEASNRRL